MNPRLALTCVALILVTLATSAPAAGPWAKAYPFPLQGSAAVDAIRDDEGWVVLHPQYLRRIDDHDRTVWLRAFGDNTTTTRSGLAIARGADGSLLVAGRKAVARPGNPVLDVQMWVAKFDADGRGLWERILGGPHADLAGAIAPDDDGGALVVGTTRESLDRYMEAVLVRLDGAGHVVGHRLLGRAADAEGADAVRVRGSWIVAGSARGLVGPDTGRDVWLFRVNDALAVNWQRAYGGPGEERASALAVAADGVVVAGSSRGSGADGPWILRLGWRGEAEGAGRYRVALADDPTASVGDVTARPDGSVVVGGTRTSASGDADFWAATIDAVGQTVWRNGYGGDDSDGLWMIDLVPGGDVVLGGVSRSFAPGPFLLGAPLLLRTASDGTIPGCSLVRPLPGETRPVVLDVAHVRLKSARVELRVEGDVPATAVADGSEIVVCGD